VKGRVGGLMLLVPLLLGAAPLGQPQPLIMALEGLRSTKGQILVCVTRVPRYFPDCSDDPDKRHFAVAARGGAVTIGNVTPGDYAIAIVHDENGNGKLDTFQFFSVTLPPTLPAGEYFAFAALAEPGSVQAGSPRIVGDISLASFSFTP